MMVSRSSWHPERAPKLTKQLVDLHYRGIGPEAVHRVGRRRLVLVMVVDIVVINFLMVGTSHGECFVCVRKLVQSQARSIRVHNRRLSSLS